MFERLENHPQKVKRKPRSKAFQAYSSLFIRSLVMSQHLPDEEVDSYAPPEGAMLEGGRPAGGDAGGILGSDAERAGYCGYCGA
ncbi:hypothetical protein JCGZ_00482 [Jatropha curcas]|uniref:Uncharacterized protein n=1 Tax=Jatropha curcas TaxID=180498 RepID=A0A067L6F5_JATCU|nr:hypothetical protein JCGZ_00482 [Jatropha curcas]